MQPNVTSGTESVDKGEMPANLWQGTCNMKVTNRCVNNYFRVRGNMLT